MDTETERAADALLEAFGRLNGTRLKSIDDPTIHLPQAMDTKEQTTREPLLSDAAIEQEVNPEDPNNLANHEYYETIGAKWVRDFYEAKITSGELRVVENVKVVRYGHKTEFTNGEPFDSCSGCEYPIAADSFKYPNNYCPGCGAKIVKP
jgi:rubrerythrin